MALTHFLFLISEILTVVWIVGWNKPTTCRNGYKCDPIAAICIVLKMLSALVQIVVMEEMFDKFDSALSEIFW